MSAAAHTDFDRAFRPGEAFESSFAGRITVRQAEAAHLVLTSGRVVACEPSGLQVHADFKPFTRRVKPGRYPVVLCLARMTWRPDWSEERVAAAMVRFNDRPPRSWEMALKRGQDVAKLGFDSYFGYGVDGGRGGFLDADVVRLLAPERALYSRRVLEAGPINSFADVMARWAPFFRRLWDARKAEREGEFPDCVELEADPQTGANVVEFSSGMGDGAYASYWGLDDAGEPCCLVTDFGILIEGLEGQADFLLTDCLDGAPDHPDLKRIGLTVRVRIVKGPPLVVRVEHKGGDCQPSIDNEGQPVRSGVYTGRGDRGTWEFKPEGPLRPDARLRLTYSLGSRPM
jgi:hypothetical protein